MKNSGKSSQHGMALLLHGGEITANVAKGSRSRGTAKGAANLLLHFGHAQVTLRLVVGKRNGEIVEQGQDLLGPPKQGIEQILGRALLGLAFRFSQRRSRRRGLSRITGGQDFEIARNPVVTLDGRNRRQLELVPLLAGVVQIEQEVVHLLSPVLLRLLGYSQTIAQQVRPADTVRTVIAIRAGKAVVHASTSKSGPDDTLFVVMLLHEDAHEPADADALATHLDGVFVALRIQIGHTQQV